MTARKPRFETREEWLNLLVGTLRDPFKRIGAPLPRRLRIAIGFPSSGNRGKAIGECWTDTSSADAHFEIFIRPDQADELEVAAILTHELTHAAVGIAAGHGPKFRRVAVALGLVGKMKATRPGPEFVKLVAPALKSLGRIPHATLNADTASTGRKKQSTRLIKCSCETCGYTTRTARKWIDDVGAPVCPVDDHGPMTAELPADDEEGEGA